MFYSAFVRECVRAPDDATWQQIQHNQHHLTQQKRPVFGKKAHRIAQHPVLVTVPVLEAPPVVVEFGQLAPVAEFVELTPAVTYARAALVVKYVTPALTVTQPGTPLH